MIMGWASSHQLEVIVDDFKYQSLINLEGASHFKFVSAIRPITHLSHQQQATINHQNVCIYMYTHFDGWLLLVVDGYIYIYIYILIDACCWWLYIYICMYIYLYLVAITLFPIFKNKMKCLFILDSLIISSLSPPIKILSNLRKNTNFWHTPALKKIKLTLFF